MRYVLSVGSGGRARTRAATGRRWRVGGGGRRAGRTRPRATARSAAAASSKAVRSRRSPVSTRSVRPVSGSISVSSPTSTRVSSRGSVISSARTAWRPAIRSVLGTPVRGAAEVGDDDDDARASCGWRRRSRGARAASRSDRRPRRPVRRRARGAGRASRRRPPAGGVTTSRLARPKVMTPSRSPRRATKRPTTSAAPSATSALRRSAVPNCIDGGLVEQEPGGQLPVRHVLADLRDEAFGRWRSSRCGGRRRPARRAGAGRARGLRRGRGRGGRRSSGHRRGGSG